MLVYLRGHRIYLSAFIFSSFLRPVFHYQYDSVRNKSYPSPVRHEVLFHVFGGGGCKGRVQLLNFALHIALREMYTYIIYLYYILIYNI